MVSVSVCCLTFNHEKYIAATLDGILMQQTDFNVEIIVHDDASTDDTASIIRSYAEKHEERIIPILQDSNMYSKGIRILPAIYWPRISGKYVAFCEGDDFWIDPHKLQKQYDFLETNPDCGLVHTDCDILDDATGERIASINHLRHISYNSDDNAFLGILTGDYVVRTLTVMVRKYLFGIGISTDIYQNCIRGDLPLWLEIANHSYFHYLPESTAVYRIVQDSLTHQSDIVKALDSQLDSKSIRRLFAKKYPTPKSTRKYLDKAFFTILLRKAFHTNDSILASQAFNHLHHRPSLKNIIMFLATKNRLLMYILKSCIIEKPDDTVAGEIK